MTLVARLSCLVVLATVVGMVQAADSVLVFTTTERPVTESQKIKSQTYRLDDANNALRVLDRKLPGTFDAAYAELQKRMNAASGRAALESLDKSYQGVVLAWELGVERLPAIVFDRQYVVYGVTSVDKAAQLFKDVRR